MIRAKINVSGQVQGVFFRRSAKLKADSLGIAGWARNIDDGSVEVMAEGDREKVDEFIKWCKKGPPFAKVEKVEIEELKGIEGFSDFSITD